MIVLENPHIWDIIIYLQQFDPYFTIDIVKETQNGRLKIIEHIKIFKLICRYMEKQRQDPTLHANYVNIENMPEHTMETYKNFKNRLNEPDLKRWERLYG